MMGNVLSFKRPAPPATHPAVTVDPAALLFAAAVLYGYAIARAQTAPRTSDTPPRYEAK